MRITFVLSRLLAGGVERVVSNLAQSFSDKGHQVTVVTLFNEEAGLYDFLPNIRRKNLSISWNDKNVLEKIRSGYIIVLGLRKILLEDKPDIVISFVNIVNIFTLLSLFGVSIPVIISEHNDPRKYPVGIFRVIRRIVYPKAKAIVSVNKHIDKYFSWMSEKKRFVIPNPLTPLINKEGNNILEDSLKKHVVAMGEFERVKGFDVLVRAFAKISNKNPNWDLWIIGDGPERGNLEYLISSLKLKNVYLPGRLLNPFPTLKSANLFVLSSRSESFGNVIIEAMACGLPIIATDCDGPREIIENKVSGILISTGEINELAGAIDELINDSKRRSFLSENGKKSVGKYNIEDVYSQWRKIIIKFKNENSI